MAVSEFNRFVLLSNVDPYTPVLWLTKFFTWLEPIANAIPLPVSKVVEELGIGTDRINRGELVNGDTFFLFTA